MAQNESSMVRWQAWAARIVTRTATLYVERRDVADALADAYAEGVTDAIEVIEREWCPSVAATPGDGVTRVVRALRDLEREETTT